MSEAITSTFDLDLYPIERLQVESRYLVSLIISILYQSVFSNQ
jgi:hypothetical protein